MAMSRTCQVLLYSLLDYVSDLGDKKYSVLSGKLAHLTQNSPLQLDTHLQWTS